MAGIKRAAAPDIKSGILYHSLRKSTQVYISGGGQGTAKISLEGMNSPIVFLGDTQGAAICASYKSGYCELFSNSAVTVQIYIFDAWNAPASSGGVGFRLRDSTGVTFDTGWHLLNTEQRSYSPPWLGDSVQVASGYAACLPTSTTIFTDLKRFYSGSNDSGGRLMQEALVISNGSISVSSIMGPHSNYDTPAADQSRLGGRFVMLSGGDNVLWTADVSGIPKNYR